MQYRPIVSWSMNSTINVVQCEMFAIDRAQPKVYEPNYFQKRNRVNGSWTKSPHPIERYCRQWGSNTLGNHCAMCPAEVDPTGGPSAGPHNFYRGGPLTTYDEQSRQAMTTLKDRIDADAATKVWETALASEWHGPPKWVHGDIAASNLLVNAGRLSAVIDFGQLGVGDVACDVAIAWAHFEGRSRHAFLESLSVDSGTSARARGWALWKALITEGRESHA